MKQFRCVFKFKLKSEKKLFGFLPKIIIVLTTTKGMKLCFLLL